MKVFVFKPTNEHIGNFKIDTFDDLESAFRTFTETRDVAPFDYLECSGRNWTVMKREGGLKLAEGRHRETTRRTLPESPKVGAQSSPQSTSRYPALQTLSLIYRIFAYVSGAIALMIAIFGIATIEGGGGTLIIWGILGGIVGVVTNLAIAEGIKVFLAIEENTRNTSLSISHQNNRDRP
ncbi:MAG: hypothetical protein HKN82_14800 [Akkermansiaceae bacterium]|nr:hypothetical protein [Akkermansiaceae bacterium]